MYLLEPLLESYVNQIKKALKAEGIRSKLIANINIPHPKFKPILVYPFLINKVGSEAGKIWNEDIFSEKNLQIWLNDKYHQLSSADRKEYPFIYVIFPYGEGGYGLLLAKNVNGGHSSMVNIAKGIGQCKGKKILDEELLMGELQMDFANQKVIFNGKTTAGAASMLARTPYNMPDDLQLNWLEFQFTPFFYFLENFIPIKDKLSVEQSQRCEDYLRYIFWLSLECEITEEFINVGIPYDENYAKACKKNKDMTIFGVSNILLAELQAAIKAEIEARGNVATKEFTLKIFEDLKTSVQSPQLPTHKADAPSSITFYSLPKSGVASKACNIL